MTTEFQCNTEGEPRFPKYIKKGCVWWSCGICHSCENHCIPDSHIEILAEIRAEREAVMRVALIRLTTKKDWQ